jgi:hypothetical protein
LKAQAAQQDSLKVEKDVKEGSEGKTIELEFKILFTLCIMLTANSWAKDGIYQELAKEFQKIGKIAYAFLGKGLKELVKIVWNGLSSIFSPVYSQLKANFRLDL